jgi:restriction endonuclease S subunit
MGAAQPNISGTQIEEIKILIPQISLIEKYEQLCQPLFNHLVSLKFLNKKL